MTRHAKCKHLSQIISTIHDRFHLNDYIWKHDPGCPKQYMHLTFFDASLVHVHACLCICLYVYIYYQTYKYNN